MRAVLLRHTRSLTLDALFSHGDNSKKVVDSSEAPGYNVIKMADQILTPALFDSLTTGTLVRVRFSSCYSGGSIELKVGRRSYSKAHKVYSLTLCYLDGRKVEPRMNRICLMKRDSRDGETFVTMALGDLGVSCKSFEVVPAA